MVIKGRKYSRIKPAKRDFRRAEEMMRRQMPKSTTDMGDRSKYRRRSKYKIDLSDE